MDRPPVFIVGGPRSGTHLLRFCLGRAPELYVCPETRFFARLYGNRRWFGRDGIAANAARIVDIVFQSGDPTMAQFAHLKPALVDAIGAGARSWREVADIVFGAFAREMGKSRWGEKTPLHILYVPQIVEVFPDARIVCLTREPRNMVASYLASSHLPGSFHKGLATWLECEAAARRHAGRMLRVSYEDLTTDPAHTLQQVCDYIGVAYDPAMLNPGMRDSSYSDRVMEFGDHIGIAPDDPDKWRAVLTPGQARLIGALAYGSGRPAVAQWRDAAAVYASRWRLRIQVIKNGLGYEAATTAFRRGRG